MHFFIPMLLLPKTRPLTYPNMKRFKGPKTDHFHSFTSLSLHNHSLRSFSFQEVEVVGERRWLLHSHSKKVLKENPARARLARVWIQHQFFKEIPLKISSIQFFFPREISCKKFKTHLQFYLKISNKKFSSFFTGKSLYNFSKKLLLRPFFKKSP